jgi:DNA polymerase III sliding clamp (beta) subunit (PCNA family)
MTLLNKRLTVQSGKSRFALQTLAAEEFPTVSVADSYNASVTLPQKTLKHLFNMVHFAMAQQDIRYYLNGLLLVLDGNNVIAVATDGHRLAFAQVKPSRRSSARKSSSRARPSSNCSACWKKATRPSAWTSPPRRSN